jgi:hypothetical protein
LERAVRGQHQVLLQERRGQTLYFQLLHQQAAAAVVHGIAQTTAQLAVQVAAVLQMVQAGRERRGRETLVANLVQFIPAQQAAAAARLQLVATQLLST